jgi:hypothetical protein
MPTDIMLNVANLHLKGYLADTACGQALAAALPLEGRAQLWGDEIYFSVPVAEDLDDTATDVVQVGDLGYWPPGQAFCIFFGPTPGSPPGEIRPASAVNLVGRLTDDPRGLTATPQGAPVRIEKC